MAQLPRPTYESFYAYTIRPGDTLYSLGRTFGVPWQDIAAHNRVDPSDLKVGSVLLIPRAEGAPALQMAAQPSPPPGQAPRRAVSAQDLHRGKPSAAFWWPTAGRLIRSYGSLVRGLREPGIALAAPAGTEVCAIGPGTVVACVSRAESPGSAWGNVVAIAHARSMVSWYGHLDRILVRRGQQVEKGEPIGTVGQSGAADSPQLAFRLYQGERPVNPLPYLP